MKAIGEVQPVGGAHFVERTSLLGFLDAMIAAEDFDEAFRSRMREADAPLSTTPLKVSLPANLRTVMLRDLPPNISLTPGRLEIIANSSVAMLESSSNSPPLFAITGPPLPPPQRYSRAPACLQTEGLATPYSA
ncbi:hypothetical protein ACPOL_0872 [Acidisarcina polymorpha]|uniref:Uncharacterized protein n=2 Tax=Acidisarcina polymorpha TaxID=2211140 RepID=A0A2Z5FTQ4_9BACT|nr:hypothetical protein ACPOL_0872 [Acidisarcina polymorpha]